MLVLKPQLELECTVNNFESCPSCPTGGSHRFRSSDEMSPVDARSEDSIVGNGFPCDSDLSQPVNQCPQCSHDVHCDIHYDKCN